MLSDVDTCEEDVAEEDIGVVASNWVHYVHYFDWHQSWEGLGEDEGRCGPGEDLDLAGDVDHEEILVVLVFLRQLGYFVYYCFWARKEEVEGG